MKHLFAVVVMSLFPLLSSAAEQNNKDEEPADVPSRAQAIFNAIEDAGIEINDLDFMLKEKDSTVPQSFEEHWTFSLPEVAPRGGQIFVCSRKKYCDAIHAYFDALKGLAGPYLYRTRDGRAVAQLNSGLSTKTAEKIEAILKKIRIPNK